MSGTDPTITTVTTLDSPTRAAIESLVAAATSADGVAPIDDQVTLEIAHGAGPTSAHLVAHDGTELVAYGHVDTSDTATASGHVVVAPDHRRRGTARTLLASMAATAGDRTLKVWAHGDLPAAQALAASLGWDRARELLQMHRPLSDSLQHPDYPDGVTVRTFETGRDEQAWLDLNARAFADHPEQGRLTLDDLRHREESDWFDADGFFLAERDGRLVGFHWTKVHADERPPYGEVYVVGVDPRAQGLGLGKRLTATGLAHLAERGLGEVRLYVDGDNAPAVAVYEKLGFTRLTVDVMYADPS